MTRNLSALAAALSALNASLLAAPGDLVPQVVLVIVGALTATVAAYAAFLAGVKAG